jgi:alpha-L-fucosidase
LTKPIGTKKIQEKRMKKKRVAFLFFPMCCIFLITCGQEPRNIAPNSVVPTPNQVEYQKMEFIGFIHFAVNTFMDKEWGYGDESPTIFNPRDFDADQWARVAKEAGMKELILTAKHHDGFCLWPSEYTEHSVKNSPWKGGKGDVVREFVDACRRHGLKVGLYLSPWDRNHAAYGTPAYLDYYRNQLKELLTGYGEISELWFDGANGGTGYYGGANEERRIDRTTYYRWEETWAMAKELQPNLLIFSDAGPDIRWIGNERGYAGKTNWSTINTDDIVVGRADPSYLNTGDPEGKSWVVPLCDTSIRPGWFYHEKEDDRVKTTQQLLDVYYNSVGRNGVLLLNVPPDTRGLFHENDIQALREFRSVLDETFATNLARGKTVNASSQTKQHLKFAPSNIVDEDLHSYWAADNNSEEVILEIDLGKPNFFDRILVQEPIRFGQRISGFIIKGLVNDEWARLAEGTTIGYKRILRIPPVHAKKIQLLITKSNNTPAISNFGLYKASPKEKTIQAVSLLGDALYSADPPSSALEKYREAKTDYECEPGNPDAIIWYGRRAAYLGKYREAIEIYTDGISKFPEDARFYRHRGHRHISVREFDRAIADFEKAAELIEGKEDEIEPDGMPNALNIPVSSLHTNIWYHLGLAYYLKNDLENALRIFQKGIEAAQNDDMLVATTHWLYMTLRLLGRNDEAKKALDPIHTNMNVIENQVYHKLCLFYKGELALENLTDPAFTDVMNDATAYGVGNWYFYNGNKEKAKEIFQKILNDKSWASFGHIAAESDWDRKFQIYN